MNPQRLRHAVTAAALLCLALFAVIAANSTGWIGRTCPGFLVLANRVVPSVALPGWPATSHLSRRQVIAVDGVPVFSGGEVYQRVRRAPSGSAVRYTIQGPGDLTEVATVVSRKFSYADYALLFGAYLGNGLAFALIGAGVLLIGIHQPARFALAGACLAITVYLTTTVDLYGPHWFFRLHVLAEAMTPATLLHLALVFPTDRLGTRRATALALIYLPFTALGIVYETVLTWPAAYTWMHLFATLSLTAGCLAMIGVIVRDFFSARSPLVRRRLGVVTLGALAALVLNALCMAACVLFGVPVPMSTGGLTAFFFPLSIGFALVQHDLFETDVVLRRALTYSVVVAAIAALYFGLLLLFGALVPGRDLLAKSPVGLALLNLGLLFLISPVRDRVQSAIDRLFYRKGYEVERALSALSQVLASARTVDKVVWHVRDVLASTIRPETARLFLRGPDGYFRSTDAPRTSKTRISLPQDLAKRVDRGDILAGYPWEHDDGPRSSFWRQLGTDLLVPICMRGSAIALLTLGPKASRRSYDTHDITFLRTTANQIALALANAAAFNEMERLNKHLEQLNVSLEQQVSERTAALHASNGELNRSLEKLQQAYAQLEESHATLLRADRLATLGRLTAGIAHEMNTPLSAVLNSLKIVVDLGREYEGSIEDPDILAEDHREIAREIITNAGAAAEWAYKATAFIRSVKMHGREAPAATPQHFLVRDVVTDAQGLVAHRLRAASCRVDFEEESARISVLGDPGRFGQVIVNLISNAIDAYEERGAPDGRILVSARHANGNVCVTVHDWAGGIPAVVLPHIFDELYTTKGPGRGTGLGLWISRNLVEEGFGGTLDVLTAPNFGSQFVITVPVDQPRSPAADIREPVKAAGSPPAAEVVVAAA